MEQQIWIALEFEVAIRRIDDSHNPNNNGSKARRYDHESVGGLYQRSLGLLRAI